MSAFLLVVNVLFCSPLRIPEDFYDLFKSIELEGTTENKVVSGTDLMSRKGVR